MTGLVLKLAPSERILINGAVIENGPRRGRLNIITPKANILRLRDAIHPDHATTPVRRICYTMQLILSGDRKIQDVAPELLEGISTLSSAFSDTKIHEILSETQAAILSEQPYQALRLMRSLLETEDMLLGRMPA